MPATVPLMVGYLWGLGTGTRIVALVVAALSAVVLAAGIALWAAGGHYAGQVERIAVFGNKRPPSSANGSVDVLFVATDTPTTKNPQRPRALLRVVLVHLSRRHDSAVLVSIPKDSLLRAPRPASAKSGANPPEKGKAKKQPRRPLSAAYADGGPAELVDTLESATSIHIDRYVELSVPAFAKAVTELDVCLPAAVRDKKVQLDLDAGEHELNGAQVAALLRATPGGGLAQVRRVQLLAGAVDSVLLGAGTVFSPFATHALLDAGVGALRVDRGFDAAATRRLALALRDPYELPATIVSVPVEGRQKTKAGTGTKWNQRLATYLFDQLRKDKKIAALLFTPIQVSVRPGHVRVRVENGTGETDLAGKVTKDLAGVGFHISGKPSNAEQDATATLIYHDARHAEQAKALRAALPGSRLKQVKGQSGTLVVVVGEDYSGVRQVTYVKGAKSGDVNDARERIEADGPCD